MSWNIVGVDQFEKAVFRLKCNVVQKIGVGRGMTVVDLGCGQGGFTVALAKAVGEHGEVLAVDVSDRYLAEFIERLDKYDVTDIVTFSQADGANLKGIVSDEVVDMAVSFRLLEELKQSGSMSRVVEEMGRVVKKNGKVCLIELSTHARNEAEEVYIRLHRESGDSLFGSDEVVEAVKNADLRNAQVETVDTNIWFSPELARQNLGFAQVWFDAEVEKNIGGLIDKYGMKYPQLLIYSGKKGLTRGPT